jgi:hypothetical protein
MPEIAGDVAPVSVVNGGAAEEGASLFKFAPIGVIIAAILVDCRSHFDTSVGHV